MDEQRGMVLLRFVAGLSAREVADIMGKQEGTGRGMWFRALEALRRALSLASAPLALSLPHSTVICSLEGMAFTMMIRVNRQMRRTPCAS